MRAVNWALIEIDQSVVVVVIVRLSVDCWCSRHQIIFPLFYFFFTQSIFIRLNRTISKRVENSIIAITFDYPELSSHLDPSAIRDQKAIILLLFMYSYRQYLQWFEATDSHSMFYSLFSFLSFSLSFYCFVFAREPCLAMECFILSPFLLFHFIVYTCVCHIIFMTIFKCCSSLNDAIKQSIR